MNTDIGVWQDEAARAFKWLVDFYKQSQALLDDAQAMFEEESWQVRIGGGWGGAAMSNWSLNNWPFIYLKSLATAPSDVDWDAAPGRAAFFGILFHGAQGPHRSGPRFFGARAQWSDPKVDCSHWMLYGALDGIDEPRKRFTISGSPIRCARPPVDRKEYRGLTEVRSFDVPLGAIRSADALKVAVRAIMSLYQGNEPESLTLLERDLRVQ